MKNLILTTIIALGVAVPSLASAMDSTHTSTAASIFAQIAAEEGAGAAK